MDPAQTAKLFESMGISSWHYNGSRDESCSSSAYFHRIYSKNDGLVDKADLADFCPAVLYELSKHECQRKAEEHHDHDHDEHDGNEDAGKAWGYGILFVTVISLGSLLGAVVVPFMASNLFQTILMAMISLAVGVLSGSGIFHLIPH
ncbi:zinc transporter ZIP14-like, partial [Paramuricea clavata]